MSASLRGASTRIMRPAVLRRLVHTQPQQSGSKFKQHKEELYDLIAKANANSTATWQDRLMLHHLCSPRPNDPLWRKVYGLKKGIAFTWFTGFVVTCLYAVFGMAPVPIVEYEGHLVTAESVPMLQERLRKTNGYHPAATSAGE